MAKDRKRNGRQFKKGEVAKRKKRATKRRKAMKIRNDGAGARSIENPQQHHRHPTRGM